MVSGVSEGSGQWSAGGVVLLGVVVVGDITLKLELL